jgi:adenosine deaminase
MGPALGAVMPPMAPLDAFCHALPKVELHVHLLGAVRPDSFAEMAARQGTGFTPA